MKKTQLKDSVRNIKNQLVSWLSIIVIASFAVAAYLGLTYSAYGLADAGKNLYESTNFRDIQITSNCMLSHDDVDAIKAVDGIKDAEGITRVIARIGNETSTRNVYFSSIPQRIGVPILRDGRLPESSDECIIEEYLSDKLDIKTGDVISPTDVYGEELPELALSEYKVTGVFVHAEHSSFDLDETYCILALPDAFDNERLDHCFSLVDIVLDKKAYHTLFEKEYFDLADTFVTKLEELGETRAGDRYDAHLAFLTDQLNDSEEELDDARDDLELAGKMVPSLEGKTGDIMSDMSNMLSVIISTDPSEFKTAPEQVDDYHSALSSYEHALKRVSDTRERYNKLVSGGECVWYVFNRNASLDFVNLKTNSENLEHLNLSFSILFVLIAIMVIFASLSRMVYEQRSLVGIAKALGMHTGEVFSKYLLFGLSSSIIGIGLGILLSLYIIETVIAIGYEDHFVFGRFPCVIDIMPTVITIIIAILVSVISIYASCRTLLKQTAKKLLSPPTPKGHNKELQKSPILSRLNLYSRMILLNIRSDIVRVLVTIISVAGCCSLTVIGFSLRAAIAGSLDRQINDFTAYDGRIAINNNLSDTVSSEVADILKENNITNIHFYHTHSSIEIDDTMEYAEFLITDDLYNLSYFRPLQDFKTGNMLLNNSDQNSSFTDGIIITNRLSELYGLNPGDELSIIDELGYKHTVKVCAVIKNYIGRYVICSKSYYEKIIDDEFKDNSFYIKADNESDIDRVIDKISEITGFESYNPASEITKIFENLLIVLNLIVGLLIILSGIMALFVLLNLANMYLLSKHTELAIMRINGFTEKETIRYATREVVFTTILGIIFGILFGIVMVYSILRNMEQVHLMFVREPSAISCIIAAVITGLFTTGIYAIAMRRIRTLGLKDL